MCLLILNDSRSVAALASRYWWGTNASQVGHRLLNLGTLTLMRWGTGPTWPHPRAASAPV